VTQIVKILESRKLEVERQLKPLREELRDINAALGAIASQELSASEYQINRMQINDAVIEAIKSGNKNPTDILDYMAKHLNVVTTKNSVNTRLYKLRKSGAIARGKSGWIVKNKKEAPNEEPLRVR